MSEENFSLEQRKQKFLDEMMSAGTVGFTGAADAAGPVAGFDPVMTMASNMKKFDKVLAKRRKDRKNGKLKEETIQEARDGKSAKDKDYSLHDWFKGGGWKQAGGKYDGKPCAKQPGQTTKPFCRDADDRASMSKDERDRRAAKKRKEDPNPDRKGKAKMVHEGKTFSDFLEEKDACYHKVKARYDVWPSAYASGALVKCRKKGASNWGEGVRRKRRSLDPIGWVCYAYAIQKCAMLFTEIKYLNLLSNRLPLFKRKSDFLWNFRCPVCGDSEKHKNKARGFVFQVKGDLIYKCHNCQLSLPLGKFIEIVDPILHKEYKLEKFKENNTAKPRKVDMRKVKRIVSAAPKFKVDYLKDLQRIDDLNKEHPAKKYILNRRLPTDSLYFTESFKAWTNSVKPGTFEDVTRDEPRIIIPFREKDGTVFGFQGRSLSKDGLRYITILLDDEHTKIFGLERIDTTKRVYVVEGPFDSLLLDNAVAMAGADVSMVSDLLGDDVVYVYDNEPRNKQITDRIAKHIKQKHTVVIWPKDVSEKDVNDMFLAGRDVKSIVKSNSYQGLKSTLKLNEWKK